MSKFYLIRHDMDMRIVHGVCSIGLGDTHVAIANHIAVHVYLREVTEYPASSIAGSLNIGQNRTCESFEELQLRVMADHREIDVMFLDRNIAVNIGVTIRSIVGYRVNVYPSYIIVIIDLSMKCSELTALEPEVGYIQVCVCFRTLEE